ncbi:hypothetical protein F4780DRAFT_777147 [Xylariomycetidae sp. FL0641]|nr:hypothetical protein F4780DRAFT_777147 [Xylariomycetidae sp. FL0641]
MASVPASEPGGFPFFSRLPPELRYLIWQAALPEECVPGLAFYRHGCWRPRWLSPSDPSYYPDNEVLNLALEFDCAALDEVRVDVPLFFVNREARAAAGSWLVRHDVYVRARPGGGGGDGGGAVFFTRAFDPDRDALYVPLDAWDQFLNEPVHRQTRPDLSDRLVDLLSPITRLAVPEAVLHRHIPELPEIFLYYFHVRELAVVFHELPSHDGGARPGCGGGAADDGGAAPKVLRPWRLDPWDGTAAFKWDEKTDQFVPSRAYTGHCLLKDASECLVEEIMASHIDQFEVRPTRAVYG